MPEETDERGGIVPCPECGARQLVELGDAGRTVICWRCEERFVVPGDRDDFDDEPRRPRSRRRREPLPPIVSPAAVVALVMGVLSAAMACVWPVSLCTSVAGLITAYFGVKTPSRKLAVAGGVLSAVGLIHGVGFLVLTIAGVSVFGDLKNSQPAPFFPPH
jgi:hypothetical protein